jgi:predicted Fe-S protein YdhL (DUF1289 family)
MNEVVESPCINVCRLDANDVCIGCFRNMEEIAQWARASDAEKRKIIEVSAQRKIASISRAG